MEDPLAPELDALFQELPGAMVEARNALADRLRKAGDKAGAARVKALKRPAPAAWALNQVHYRTPALLEAARAATAEVRALHARDAVDPRALLAAHEAQRGAARAVIEAALAHSTAAGLPNAAPQQRRLLATLQALLTGAGAEAAGRLTQELEPGGFDAIESVGLMPARPPAGPGTANVGAAPRAPAATAAASASAERERARAALTQAEKELREAEAIAHKRRSAARRSEIERDKIRAALADAERERARLADELEAQEADFQAAEASLGEAEALQAARRDAVTEARRALARHDP